MTAVPLVSPASLKRTAPAEFKLSADKPTFEGYAAVFLNTDDGGDAILPGAFKEFATTRDGKTVLLYQHSLRDPIGKADVRQDSHGLHVRGELVSGDGLAEKVYRHMKAGVLDSMSVGYDVLPGGSKTRGDGVRELSGLKLYEASIVTFGMNTLARIDAVKSVLECADVRELEHLLRDTLFLSGRKAKAAANAMWPILGGERDAHADDRDDQEADTVKAGTFLSMANDLKSITELQRSYIK